MKRYGIIDDSYWPLPNVYELRVKGLTQELTKQELASAILHLTKHRGSTIETVEDNEESAKEAEQTKKVLNENAKALSTGKHVCEIQLERLNENGSVRGHENHFKTKDYVKEAKAILSHQPIAEELKEAILQVIQCKRAYYEGPGSEKSPTPYGRFIEVDGTVQEIDLIDKMRGKCSVYPQELRAPKMSLSAELFNFLNDLNNLSVQNEKLCEEQKEKILQVVSAKGGITFKQLAKLLQVAEDEIKGYRIDKNGKPLLTEFKGYKKIKKLFAEYDRELSLQDFEMIDFIIEIITKKKGIEERKAAFAESEYALEPALIERLSSLSGVTGYHALSFKAIRELNTELYHSDKNQMQLLHEMQLFDKHRISQKGRKNIQADSEAILSPVAKRAQAEAFKVINQLRKQYGEFDSIVVEMTRDKNSDERKKRIRDKQKYFEGRNKEVDTFLQDAGYDPERINGKTKAKIRLYLQQDGKSAYTLQPLDLRRVISDPSYVEIDHIIPISISLDDSQNNKVLITQAENQLKGNQTPIAAYQKGKFTGLGCTMESYIHAVKNAKNIPYKKKNNLLYQKDITKYSVIQEFINRNLIDTSYACRVVLNTLNAYFKDNEIQTKVHTVNGRLTDRFRTQIHLEKDREEDYLHHAVDALIVASIKKLGLLRGYLSKYSFDTLYDEFTGEIKEIPEKNAFFDPKYIAYIVNLKRIYEQSNQYYWGLIERNDMLYPPIKLSHKINTKPNRQVADETIYSTRHLDGKEMIIQKYKNIYDPKFTALTEDILNDDTDKYLMARNDPQTFAQIKDIIWHHYEQFKESKEHYKMEKSGKKSKIKLVGENPLTAYENGFGKIKKYSKKGNGPVITMMKYSDGQLGSHIDISRHYPVHDKKVILKQVSPYRTDIYRCRDGKFRFVTVRYCHVFYKAEKGKYIIDAKWYAEEKEKKKIDETAQFICSLHRDELIGIVRKAKDRYIYDDTTEGDGEMRYHDGVHPEILKFTATNNDKTGTIEVKPIFTYCKKRLMLPILSYQDVRKYATDVLGNLYQVKENILKLEFE